MTKDTTTIDDKDAWKLRRRVLYTALLYIAFNVSYIAHSGRPDDALQTQIALSLIGIGGALIATYVFGAVYDDHSKRKNGTGV